ncbi:hypothetical protein C8R47DRAFT_1158664 [Mycena vitilis]|nr:hypothetical protein C8R47DRAFT_1167910 [Mycena vitilis]KAJ6462298.1 hypothetical protein C8R47DRAFT_1158664 [Mycena vitilis]
MLGQAQIAASGRITHDYIARDCNQPAPVVIIGALGTVVDRKNEPKVLVLNVPEGSYPIVSSIFQRQLKILDDVVQRDQSIIERFVINQKPWSHGPAKGVIYVRLSDGCKIDSFDLSGRPDHPLNIAAKEIQITPFAIAPVPLGSLLMCEVFPFRADVPDRPSSSENTLFSRVYGLQASHVVHVYRSY